MGLVALAASTGCPAPVDEDAPRYNLLLISIDSLRADHVAAAGYERDTTPVLDALLDEGTWFANAVSAAPWTTPSMMTVLTGLEPEAHRVQAPQFTLDPDAETLAERLRAAGYRTLGVTPAATLDPSFGFTQGFEAYTPFRFGHFKLTSRQINAEARRLLGGEGAGRPWFLWVHYWDPHYNYNPPAPEAGRYAVEGGPSPGTEYNIGELKQQHEPLSADEVGYLVSQFDAEIRYTDRFLGELLEAVEERGETGRTLVVILADHGEAFQEHGWLGHTNRVDETLVHVPLAFRLPGVVRAGARVAQPVGLVDVFPTVLDLLGVAYEPDAVMGQSLAPALRGDATIEPRPLASETVRRGAWYALRLEGLKYVLDFSDCSERLFDLDADPGETRDLALERASDLERLRAAAARRLHRSRSLGLDEIVMGSDASRGVMEELRKLGYIQGAGPQDPIGDPSAESTDLRPGRCFSREAP